MRCLHAWVAALLLAAPYSAVARDVWPPWSQFDPIAPSEKRSSNGPQPTPSTKPPHDVPHNRPTKVGSSPPVPSKIAAWKILRTSWSDQDEKGFAEFVQRIGESSCRSVHSCLTSPSANPLYYASNPPDMHFYADCADLPYMLRAYYSWKNGLPFSYSAAVSPLGPSNDLRYTARGNMVTDRRDLVAADLDARLVLSDMADTISSAHYRIPPGRPGRLLPDHYPVRIASESIKPGTIIYDANGHVAVVYKVTTEGRILYMDTHPDNSLTRSVYGKAFSRASPPMGAGFKRWRPLKLVGAEKRADGTFERGRIVLTADTDISDWSDEQYYGTGPERSTDWRMARFEIEGKDLDFHDFVRRRMAGAEFKYDPLDETHAMIRSLCSDIKYRIDSVEFALKAGIHLRPQPERLPNNIYATVGDWETYSTPSRDARLKTEFKELRDAVARFLSMAAEKSELLSYSGSDLRRDLEKIYREEASKCAITYIRTNGSAQELSFAELSRRLFLLSFDPYHCVEHRWGAYEEDELSTCGDGPTKKEWYAAEQRLRNQPDRTYDVQMGFSLADLKSRVRGSGIDDPPYVDVLGLLRDRSR